MCRIFREKTDAKDQTLFKCKKYVSEEELESYAVSDKMLTEENICLAIVVSGYDKTK